MLGVEATAADVTAFLEALGFDPEDDGGGQAVLHNGALTDAAIERADREPAMTAVLTCLRSSPAVSEAWLRDRVPHDPGPPPRAPAGGGCPRPPPAPPGIMHGGGPVRHSLRLMPLPDRTTSLRVEVVDSGRGWDGPASRSPFADADECHGRGLHLVDALAAEWGHEVLNDGHTVWADLAVPAAV
ncbi:ATP-binding protein [Streptomyces bicolor]|uniref:ATP-binding protein n=1 Tax=Streptomyces bicolor TaxID=66874 RepID=UPI00068A0C98|nr:ATP-binding protein [Streptomyces bicolor]